MIKFGNFVVTDNNSWLGESSSPGPTPPTPVLPANTVRVRTSDGNAPIKGDFATYETATLVEGTNDVYDVYKSGTSFENLLFMSSNVTEVLGANTTGITNMRQMFTICSALTTVALFDTSNVTNMSGMFSGGCTSLTTVPLFDTSSVTSMYYMFAGCSALTTVPLFNTSSVTDMNSMCKNCTSLTAIPLFNTSSAIDMSDMFRGCSYLRNIPLFNTSSCTNMDSMFYSCWSVTSGALALYQQASTQTNPPSSHSGTFHNCGYNSTTGRAELDQIPSGWK